MSDDDRSTTGLGAADDMPDPAALAWVDEALGDLDSPVMPADVRGRLDAAIRAEARHAESDQQQHPAVDHSVTPIRPRRHRRLPALLGVAAALVLLALAGVVTDIGGGPEPGFPAADSAGTSVQDTQPDERPEILAASVPTTEQIGEVMVATGTDYRRESITAAAGRLLQRMTGRHDTTATAETTAAEADDDLRGPAPGGSPTEVPDRTAAEWAPCVQAIQWSRQQPVVVDVATFEGESALIVLRTAQSPDGFEVVVRLTRLCDRGSSVVLTEAVAVP